MTELEKYSRILVCGGRNFSDSKKFILEMNRLKYHKFAPKFCVIQGGASGADRLARDWAMQIGQPVIEVPANWGFFGAAAGPIRNIWMLEYCAPDLVVAFPGGRGTQNMIAKSYAHGIKVIEIY